MTLKDLRDDLSRKISADRSLADVELNHVCVEDVKGNFIVDYLLRDDSDVVEDEEEEDEYNYDDDSELEDDDDDGDWWKDGADDDEDDCI